MRRRGKPLCHVSMPFSSTKRGQTHFTLRNIAQPSESSMNTQFRGFWLCTVHCHHCRPFCAYHHQSHNKNDCPCQTTGWGEVWCPPHHLVSFLFDVVRRVRSLSCRSFLFNRLSTRCAHLMVPSLCFSKRWGGTSLLIMPSLCFSTWHDRGGYSSRLHAIPFINNM